MGLMDKYVEMLDGLKFEDMYNDDFLLTWEKSEDELKAVFTVAEALRELRKNNISSKIFDSGLGISLFTQLELDLALHQLVICLDLKFKT